MATLFVSGFLPEQIGQRNSRN